ncbi:hypothetical protein ACRBEV_30560 [Methylobacterium phyllosphaerae]
MTDQTGRSPRENPEGKADTEPKTPRQTLGQMEDKTKPGSDLGEAIDRATAAVGQDDGKR